MNKLITTFMVLFLVASILSAIMEGGGGISATRLTSTHTAIATTFNVTSTSGFLKAGYLYVGNEQIRYTNTTATTFTNCTRGYNDTLATVQPSGTMIYSPDAGVMNATLGFNVASTGATVGAISIPVIIGQFFFTTIPRIVTWDYAWLKYGDLQYLRWVFAAFTTGFVIYVALQVIFALGGVLSRVFTGV